MADVPENETMITNNKPTIRSSSIKQSSVIEPKSVQSPSSPVIFSSVKPGEQPIFILSYSLEPTSQPTVVIHSSSKEEPTNLPTVIEPNHQSAFVPPPILKSNNGSNFVPSSKIESTSKEDFEERQRNREIYLKMKAKEIINRSKSADLASYVNAKLAQSKAEKQLGHYKRNNPSRKRETKPQKMTARRKKMWEEEEEERRRIEERKVIISVSDPYHVDADPDPDPRIRFRDDGSGLCNVIEQDEKYCQI